MTDRSLEGIVITFSAGIGTNVKEAEAALKEAKKKKDEDYYNFVVYEGEHINGEKAEPNPHVEPFRRLQDRLKDNNDASSDLKHMKYDPKTGLLNKLGYAIETSELEEQGEYDPDNRLIVLFDGNNMKINNELHGYSFVDEYLDVIGKAIVSASRTRNPEHRLVHRKNDSGGDEFVLDLNAGKENAGAIVKRFIDAMYDAQKIYSAQRS